MVGKFLKDVSFLVAINIAVKVVFVFGIDIGVQNEIGTDYGIYFTVLNFTLIFQVLTSFGIENFNQHQVAGHLGIAKRLFPNLLTFKLMLGFLYLAVVVGVGYFLGYWAEFRSILVGLSINQVLLGLILYLRSNVTALGHYRMDSFFSALDKLLMIFLILPMLWVEDFPLELSLRNFVLAQTIALAATVLAVGFFVWTRMIPLVWKLDWKYMRLIWRDSKYFALIVFLMFSYTRLDGVMIPLLHPRGIEEAAIYAASYRLLDAFNMLGFLFASFLVPMFAQRKTTKAEKTKLHLFSASFLFVLYCSVSFGLIFVAKDMLTLLYDHSTPYWAEVCIYLFPSCIGWSLIYTSGAYLTAKGLLKPQIYLFVGGVLLNVILNIWWIPIHGALGAAYSTLITQLAMGLGIHYLSIRLTETAIDFDVVKRWVLYLFGFLAVAKWAINWNMEWILQMILMVGMGVAFAFATGVISLDHIREAFLHNKNTTSKNT